jgi:type I restriction enzyme R subunit
MNPEEFARQQIDQQLTACGWVIQDRLGMNLFAACGVAVREFPLETGEADYLLFVDRKAVGIVEALKSALEQFEGIAADLGEDES